MRKKSKREVSFGSDENNPSWLSSQVNLLNLFTIPQASPKPDSFTPKSWEFITNAVEYIHELEIKELDALVTTYVAAIVRAKGCGCPSCIRKGNQLTAILETELRRQSSFNETERLYGNDRNIIQRDIETARIKQLEITNHEWDMRTQRLRQLIDIAVKNIHLSSKGFSKKEREEIGQLLLAARERRKKWRK